jgi:hypothetical protein
VIFNLNPATCVVSPAEAYDGSSSLRETVLIAHPTVAKHAYKRLSTIVTSVKDLGDCHFEQGKPGTRKTFDEDSDASVGSQLPISHPINWLVTKTGKFSVNGMVRRRSLEVVECGGKETSHETTSARH